MDLDKLLNKFVTERRIAKDKLFKTQGFYLTDIVGKLGIERKLDTSTQCDLIVKTLVTQYAYFGEYSTGMINAFLKMKENARNGSIPDSIKLQDISRSSSNYGINSTESQLLSSLLLTEYNYLGQNDISKFSSKKYNTDIIPRINEVEKQRYMEELMKQKQLAKYEHEQRVQREQQRMEELKREQQRIEERNRKLQLLEEREHKHQRMEQRIEKLKREQQQRYMERNREQQQKQHQQKYIDENNPVINEPLQNDFLANKEMRRRRRQVPAQPLQERPILSHARIGMNELAHIVLDMQRDFKRVANALSVQGAQEIIDKHNYNSPDAPWHVTSNDENGDNIPDIIIRNANGDPIVVNGWTTKGSDYPERYQYYNAYPTRAERRAHPYPAYKKDVLYNIQYDMDNTDVHKRGDVTQYNQNAFPDGWDTSKYNVNRTPGKRLSAYQRFQKLIAIPILDMCTAELARQHEIELNAQGKWKDKMSFYAQVSADLWNHYIINEVARRIQMDVESKQFRKFKNSDNGKQYIDNTVTEFYYHLHHTNGTQWTEESRDRLQQEFLHFAADALTKLVRQTGAIEEGTHRFPTFHEDNVQPFNQETEGEFGINWDYV